MKNMVCVLLSVVLLMLLVGCGKNDIDQAKAVKCTLKEAWEIALSDAWKWADDAEAILISSTDNHDSESAENGAGGKRRCWSFMFHSDEKDKQYSVYVIDGKAVYGQEASTPRYATFSIDDIVLDSDELCSLVQGQLKGGVNWAWGYHYIVQYRYMDENGEVPQLTVSVRGINDAGQERYMIYNPYTGVLQVVLDKTGYDENGRSIWEIVEDYREAQNGQGGQQVESTDSYAGKSREELEEMREQIEEEFSVYESAVQYRFDPEEFYNAVIDGLVSGRFSPFSNCKTYENDEEWKSKMEAYYGEGWEALGE